MIFLALPALQLSQRDTQRKSDITRLKAAYQHYKVNSKSGIRFTDNYVKNFNDFMDKYMRTNGESFKDPNGAMAQKGEHTTILATPVTLLFILNLRLEESTVLISMIKKLAFSLKIC